MQRIPGIGHGGNRRNLKSKQGDKLERKVPDVAFLGVAERATYLKNGPRCLWNHQILGLSNYVVCRVLPIDLRYLKFVFAVYLGHSFNPAKVRCIGPEGSMKFEMDLDVKGVTEDEGNQNEKENGVYEAESDWFVHVVDGLPVGVGVDALGRYTFTLIRNESSANIGWFEITAMKTKPLTQDKINAIKSDPYAAKTVWMTMNCHSCETEMTAYTGLSRDAEREQHGDIWYEELPDVFECLCGNVSFNLSFLKQNMHALLGLRAEPASPYASTRLYETRFLIDLREHLNCIITDRPAEEEIQKVFENNPILLHQFGPQRVFFKTRILSQFVTDITIINSKKELVLIELERVDIRLVKKDGGISALLQHAIGQVEDWMQKIDDHRMAVLDCMNLKPEEVGAVRGVVIAGADRDYEPRQLSKLKRTVLTRTSIYTYDDVLGSLNSLIREFDKM